MLLKAFFEKIAGCHQTARLPKYSFQHYFFQEVDFVCDLQHNFVTQKSQCLTFDNDARLSASPLKQASVKLPKLRIRLAMNIEIEPSRLMCAKYFTISCTWMMADQCLLPRLSYPVGLHFKCKQNNRNNLPYMDLFNMSASRLSVEKINTAKKSKHCTTHRDYVAYPRLLNKI